MAGVVVDFTAGAVAGSTGAVVDSAPAAAAVDFMAVVHSAEVAVDSVEASPEAEGVIPVDSAVMVAEAGPMPAG